MARHAVTIATAALALAVLLAALIGSRPASSPEDSDVVRVTFTADGRKLLGGTRNGLIYLWGFPEGQLLAVRCIRKSWLDRSAASFNSLAIAADGQFLVVAGRRLSLLPLNSGDRIPAISVPTFAFGGASISPNTSVMAAISSREHLLLWNLHGGPEWKDFGAADSGVYGASTFSSDGKRLAIAGHTIRMLDAATGQGLWRSIPDSYAFLSLAFRPDGEAIATGSQDASVRIWSARTGVEVTRFKGHRGYVDAVSFNPSGNILASWARDGQLFLWDLSASASRHILLGTTKGDAAFSPDGHWVVSGGPATTVLLWDATTKAAAKTFSGVVPAGRDVACSPD